MNKIKKTLCLLLSLVFVFAIIPTSASASTNGHTAAEALAWVNAQVGKSLDYDGYYGAQCVDLIKYYYDYLGCASYARGNGCDYATNALPSGWARYKDAQPQPGDILVYTGNSSNPYGHVAIYEADRVTYHQNLNYNQWVVCSNYYYKNLTNPYWGVIRPDFSAAAPTAVWEGPTVGSITETNAVPAAKITFNQRVHTTAAGLRIYDSNNNLVASSRGDNVNYNYTYVTFSYDINAELGYVLASGKTYLVRFYTISNGREYWSPSVSFTTKHTHVYTSTTVYPTCTENGVETFTCACGSTYTETIPAIGHSFKKAVTPPTETANGYTTYICQNCGYSYISDKVPATGIAAPSKVKSLKSTAQTSSSVTLTWSKSSGATGYAVYKYSPSSNKYTRIGTTANNSYKISGLLSSTKNVFAVRAYKTTGGKTVYGKMSGLLTVTTSKQGKPAQVAKPKVTKQTATTITLSWTKVGGADVKYYIFSYNAKTKKYKVLGSTTSNTFTAKKLKSGTKYSLAVQAYGTKSKKYGNVSPLVSTATAPAAPTITVSAGKKQATVKWNNVSGATSYTVYISTSKSGTYRALGTTDLFGAIVSGLSSSKTYYFKVTANKNVGNKTIKSAYSTTKSVKVK